MRDIDIENAVEEKLIEKAEAREKETGLSALEVQLIDCGLLMHSIENRLKEEDLSEWARKMLSIRLETTKKRYTLIYNLIQCDKCN